MARSEYVNVRSDKLSLIDKVRNKYNELYLFGDLNDLCKRFNVSENLIRKIAYPVRKTDITTLNFDSIIRLSNMLEIPYEDFINYNAQIEYYRNKLSKDIMEEDEMLKQYKVGDNWEKEVLDYYNKRGYFTYKIPTMNSGTVFDILIIKNGSAMCIECKHIDSDKLYYQGSGILKKRDELDHFVKRTNNNVYIYVKSDKTGTWWTTWLKAKPIFEEKGYITVDDCFKCDLTTNKNLKNYLDSTYGQFCKENIDELMQN